jgi:hypothetical protein
MHLSFTLSTVPMLLLGVYLWHLAKGQFLPVALFMSVFAAASVVNLEVGGLQIGVQPAYVTLLLALGVRLFGRRPRKMKSRVPLASTTLLIALFVTYAAVSAFVSPLLFSGIPITNAKLGGEVPLRFELGHLNQLAYLLLSFAIYLVAAYRTPPAELTKSLNWFIGGAVLAALIGFYQFAAERTGLPFPRDFLYTNTYVMYDAYEINGFTRVNSTFSEASAMAFSLTIALALVLWRLLSGSVSRRNVIYAGIIVTGLILTLSTTGYLCLTYLLAVAVCRYFFHWVGNERARLAKLLLAFPALVVTLTLLGLPAARESFVKLVHTVILDKEETTSYQERTRMNDNSLTTAAATYWLGAGWGVCRASSFIPTVLGNVGLPGALLFFTFCFRLIWSGFRKGNAGRPVHGAVVFALGAVLVDLAVAAPEIVSPIIWLLFAVTAKLEGNPSFSAPPIRQLAFREAKLLPSPRRRPSINAFAKSAVGLWP